MSTYNTFVLMLTEIHLAAACPQAQVNGHGDTQVHMIHTRVPTQVATQVTHKPTATLRGASTCSPGGEGVADEHSLSLKPASASLSPGGQNRVAVTLIDAGSDRGGCSSGFGEGI